MSVFYGNVSGNRGEATRQGSRDSGISTAARSYLGSIIVDLSGDERETGDHHARISFGRGSTAIMGRVLYSGALAVLATADYLLPATLETEYGEDALDVRVPGVGTVRITAHENEDEDGNTTRSVSARIIETEE